VIEDKGIWSHESAYLERVMNEIKTQIDAGVNAADNYKNDAIRLQKSMWEDLRCAPAGLSDLEDVVQVNQIQMDLSNKARLYKFSYEKVSHLTRMRKSPCFGRIDFLERGEKKEERIYIGIYNLYADDTMDSLVYDWRAPVSGMFYDYEIGPSSYSCPAGLIEGELLLKRQYKIEDSRIVYMFDSSLNINDAMLQEMLGKSTDSRMRTIVTSIQREQNTVIRNSQDRILIVEGPAGSGKTSIALHRAAYLLYKYRETVKSENILIFSPNHVFEDYISHVLPELGEENVRRSTFADFFETSFLANRQVETMNQQMEYILASDDSDDIRLKSIRFKSSPRFLAALKRYVQYLESGTILAFKDLIYNDTLLISAEDIIKLYKNQSDRLPYANRLEKLRQRLFSILKEQERKRVKDSFKNNKNDREEEPELKTAYELLKSDILQMTTFDICSLYVDMFKNIESYVQAADNEIKEYIRFAGYTIRELAQGIIDYEDLAPIVYLKAVLEGESISYVKHVIIDEAQDYTAVQYEIFRTIFKNCNMTVLGDINQAVNGYMNIGSFDMISDIFKTGAKRIALSKSYRSSRELADFCKGLLVSPGKSEQLNRHGAKPKVIKAGKSNLYKRIAEDIVGLKNKGNKLIAVICRTASECRDAYRAISLYMNIGLISNQNEAYYGDCFVIPSYLAKGLEFDAVLVHSIEDKEYNAPEDRRLLYTVCTRALHELYLYFFDKMSGFISDIDENLYTIDDAGI
jgi:DNA helicase-2/ATP-dependent DNA helicase PcrA